MSKPYADSDLQDEIEQIIVQIEQTPPGHPDLAEDVEATLQHHHIAVEVTTQDSNKVKSLLGLAFRFRTRYQQLGGVEDLEVALQNSKEALQLTPTGHSDRKICLQELGLSLSARYHRFGNVNDMNSTFQSYQELLELTPESHPDRAVSLQLLATAFTDRYQRFGDTKDLETGLQMDQEAVDLTPTGLPQRPQRLHCLAVSLMSRYKRLGDVADLNHALQANEEAINLTPEQDLNKAGYIQNLANAFGERYQRLGDVNDLNMSLEKNLEALDLVPDNHPERPWFLENLGYCFRDKYHRLGDLKDLEAALAKTEESVDLTPEGHPDRPKRLRGLAAIFGQRHQRLGDMKDLENALQRAEEAVMLIPEGHPEKAKCLQDLAVSYKLHYYTLGNLQDLEAALQNDQKSLELIPKDHPQRAGYLQHLAMSLTELYRRSGNRKDIETALQLDEESVELTPKGHPERAWRLQNLTVSFRDHFELFGDLKYLANALNRCQEAIDLTPSEDPERAGRLQSLGALYGDRYKKLGDLKDLNQALHYVEEALILTPLGQRSRAGYMYSMAVLLGDRHQRLGVIDDLQTAIQRYQEAIQLTSVGHPLRPRRLQGLAVALNERFQRLGDVDDAENAFQTFREALNLTRGGHPERARFLQGLAMCFKLRYRKWGDLKDLENALQIDQESIDLTPEGHPQRVERLQSLAVGFTDRYYRLRDQKDIEAAYIHYNASFKTSHSVPELSWEAALNWAAFVQEFWPPHCIAAYTAAFNLLPEIVWIGHSIPVRHTKLYKLGIGQAISSAVRTCCNLYKLASAVEFMEQGVATIFQQMLQLKTDVEKPKFDHAEKFQKLSSALYTETSEDIMQTVNERNRLLEEIRKQPGLEYFLLPKPYSALCEASSGGPIVILNSHANGCDGIVILNPTSDPIHVPLQDVKQHQLKSYQMMLGEVLGRCTMREAPSTRLFGQREDFAITTPEEKLGDLLIWLWTHIVAHVYKALASYNIHCGRLWWLPIGLFKGMPLHACPPNDLFIHSYTATLGSLLNARAKEPTIPPKVGIVGVTHTGPGRANSLEGVKLEIQNIISIVKKPRLDCLEGKCATVEAVTQQLQECSWIHLACHGKQDLAEPENSHLLLYKDILKLDTILRMSLPNAQFVFLAACQTAMGDQALVNESFHLGGAFIAGGFRGAIGTLWAMYDEDGPPVAEVFYGHLFRGDRTPKVSDAAEALHLAVKELKQRNIPRVRWIPFIHMGI
ncbi:CHAT domain-containing protein [Mycena galopus ATCC 62051]|nr:CHAT domain-containing protein [Mycena galopus ATCC 62051]